MAHAFHDAGLFLGDDLIGAAASNPYGHFESQAIVDFHKQQIADHRLASKLSFIHRGKASDHSATTSFQDGAKEILDRHFHNKEEDRLVGWKDPRTPFFLDGWHQVLSDPHYIFVVRHPVHCVRSLNHRTRANAGTSFFPFLSTRHFNLWEATNLCIADFVSRHPDRCTVLHAPDDLVSKIAVDQLNDLITKQWHLDLAPLLFEKVIDPQLLMKSNSCPKLEKQYLKRPKTMALYDHLITLSKK